MEKVTRICLIGLLASQYAANIAIDLLTDKSESIMVPSMRMMSLIPLFSPMAMFWSLAGFSII